MNKRLVWVMGLLLLCLAVPVCADEGWDGWVEKEPDVSSISLTPVSETDLFLGQEWAQDYVTVQLRINSPDYIFNDTYYIEDATSSNPSMWVSISEVQNNILTLKLYMVNGTDISSNIAVTINGKTFNSIPIRIRKISLSKNSVLLAKGKKTKLKIKCGNNTVSKKAIWTSSNKKVATVDNNGNVKSKKVGNTVIIANMNGKKVGCIVSVSTKKKISAIKIARKIVKTCKYNQRKRMSSKYYDCSSLVWKAYHKNGCNFGSSSYAPTAAAQAKYMDKHHKSIGKITQKRINKLYYQVGDVCYHCGGKNGRYKNIYHTELFSGYSFCGFDEKGGALVALNGIRSYVAVGDPIARP